MKQPIIFAGVILTGIIIGGHLAGHIFFGVILLGGLIALVENIPFVKYLVYKGNNLMDVSKVHRVLSVSEKDYNRLCRSIHG